MNRSWLIGATLVLSLSAAACKDDDEDETIGLDGGPVVDAGRGDAGSDASILPTNDAGPIVGIDSGVDAGLTADAGRDSSVPSDASTLPPVTLPVADAGRLDSSVPNVTVTATDAGLVIVVPNPVVLPADAGLSTDAGRADGGV